MIKGIIHSHLEPIWYNSEPLDIPYSPNQYFGWDFFAASYSFIAMHKIRILAGTESRINLWVRLPISEKKIEGKKLKNGHIALIDIKILRLNFSEGEGATSISDSRVSARKS